MHSDRPANGSIMTIESYPLTWPPGWRRAPYRIKAQFKGRTGGFVNGQYAGPERLTIGQGMTRLTDALRRLSGTDVIVSTNLKLNRDGTPNRSQGMPSDPGVAVYWKNGKQSRCMAIDTYDRLPDNLAAIAATLDAMRAIERYGGALILDRAFQGFAALPAPVQPFQVLGIKHDAGPREVDEAYKRLASENHPDKGGDSDKMAQINWARDAMLENFPTP